MKKLLLILFFIFTIINAQSKDQDMNVVYPDDNPGNIQAPVIYNENDLESEEETIIEEESFITQSDTESEANETDNESEAMELTDIEDN